ncbi:sigma factor-like helix-turn-helix DNA-binding protein [Streptomyces sp. GbtcB7]|uniref:sigma factor-like helix-turn-helix DNA-binding protein n=1 Tax=Streptomyces sp. GbtcB7 TaxID=2824752 RepID=UPI0027E55D26|nr:sigma factor-like helix-turn-helix DNA-binding protein [Streptomyces sp. GbtcB7]
MERESNGGRGRQADLTGFEEFYQSAYARLVGQLFSVTGSLEQAEDVVQEAFIRALDRWPRIQAYDMPELWVRRVPVNQRPVLLLHDVLDLPIEEVAEQLGLPVSAVRGRLARVRAKLARHLAADPEGALSRHGRP